MKNSGKELDIDFIGGLGALTQEDEKAISDFLKARKKKNARGKTRLSSRKNPSRTAKIKA